MGRQLTDQEVVMAMCNMAMRMFFTKGGGPEPHLDTRRRSEWIIWASRHQECPECKQQPYYPCFNMTDVHRVKSGAKIEIRFNRHPHDSRVDWYKLLEGLKKRGYWRESIRREIRREMARRA